MKNPIKRFENRLILACLPLGVALAAPAHAQQSPDDAQPPLCAAVALGNYPHDQPPLRKGEVLHDIASITGSQRAGTLRFVTGEDDGAAPVSFPAHQLKLLNCHLERHQSVQAHLVPNNATTHGKRLGRGKAQPALPPGLQGCVGQANAEQQPIDITSDDGMLFKGELVDKLHITATNEEGMPTHYGTASATTRYPADHLKLLNCHVAYSTTSDVTLVANPASPVVEKAPATASSAGGPGGGQGVVYVPRVYNHNRYYVERYHDRVVERDHYIGRDHDHNHGGYPPPPPPPAPTGDSTYRPGDIDSSSGQEVARILPDGVVDNASGQEIAKIQPDGVVDNASGQEIAKIQPDGVVDNASGQEIAQVQSNGDIDNGSGQEVGQLQPDGTVDNAAGQEVGTVPPGDEAGALLLLKDQIDPNQNQGQDQGQTPTQN
ncbi:hypothetical protein E3E12_07745 [Formicincola oecophyllae]|uniref:Uncharacterized protein n=1 Tax=Formicincola oecophyllae TaxID=2558361 RepID=A0A4Y6UBZ2_9PROT|nr:hypothetical protein [Formicincola oecophyllae]QDH14088.1 hypothetical protein E3E12_07745 [Formicincola oecophyllae]